MNDLISLLDASKHIFKKLLYLVDIEQKVLPEKIGI